MILDKLIEKKDMLAYLSFRIDELIKTKKEIPQSIDKELRHTVYKMMAGKITELRKLKEIVKSNAIKKSSKSISTKLKTEEKPR